MKSDRRGMPCFLKNETGAGMSNVYEIWDVLMLSGDEEGIMPALDI